jgi:molybdate transport system substrate-binding protein
LQGAQPPHQGVIGHQGAAVAQGEGDLSRRLPEGADEIVNLYEIAAVADSASPGTAAAFVDFVLSDEGQAILEEFGFGAP